MFGFMPLAARRLVEAVEQEARLECWCENCDVLAHNGLRSRMSVCPDCGDKRCPHALQHDKPCTHRT